MTKARRIIYDCDGVLADWTEYLLQTLDCGLTVDDVDDFKLKNVLRRLKGHEVARQADAICSQPRFTASQPVLPWAQELVNLARTLGDLIILTAPWASKGWYDARVEWLRKNLGIPQDSVIVGHAKEWVRGDLFIDDKPTNIIKWCEQNPDGCAVLLAWPYNINHPELPINARRLTPNELLIELRAGFPGW